MDCDLLPCAAEHPTGASFSARPLDDASEPVEHLAREARRREAGALDRVTDAHVHLFPDGFYRALWRWFDTNLWPVHFRGTADEVLAALEAVGVARMIALVYAHKPGVAAYLNRYLAELCRAAPQVVGVGTVLPGEPDALAIVREALGPLGLRGIKLHCHVQRLAIDDPRVLEVLAECERARAPAVVHCGREPAHPAYGVDTHALCNAARAERVLRALPSLTLVVPHVGADEYADYLALLDKYPGLYLDTSMACAEYFPTHPDWTTVERHAGRIMYGSDFPITPYAPDRELRLLARRIEDDGALAQLLRGTAARVWGA